MINTVESIKHWESSLKDDFYRKMIGIFIQVHIYSARTVKSQD